MSISNQVVDGFHDANSTVCKSKWLHKTRYITSDELGNVFWKGFKVDFIKDPNEDINYDHIKEISKRCEHLENIDVHTNMNTVVYYFNWFGQMKADNEYKKLLIRCPVIRVNKESILFIFKYSACYFDGKIWRYYKFSKKSKNEYQKDWNKLAPVFNRFSEQSLIFSSLDNLFNCLKEFKIPVDLLDVMSYELNLKDKVYEL